MSELTVNLADDSYKIVIERGAIALLGQRCLALNMNGLAVVISNVTVAALYGAIVQESLEMAGFVVAQIEMPDGEEYKNSSTLNRIYDDLLAVGADRSSFIVALGGGVVGDVAGFAAATWMRGIPFVQVPTTLLAQVDSSVGGKTGIDHPKGKNLIGAFYQPRLVLIDVDTLSTLDRRQYCAGLAEVIKYGVVIDQQFFELIEKKCDAILKMEPEILIEIIRRSCQLKAQVVELDEKESGLRTILNYGHTLGHAFEALSDYRDLVHGEAVAIGMVLAARVSETLGHSSQEDVSRIQALISNCDLPVNIPKFERQELLSILASDKKSKAGNISFICNQGIGNYVISQHNPEELFILSGLEVFKPQLGPETPLSENETEIIEDIEILEELDIYEEDQFEADHELKKDIPEPLSSAASDHDPLSTGTLAELYVSQGFIHKAIKIYRAILADNPSDQAAADRVAALEALESVPEVPELPELPGNSGKPEKPVENCDCSNADSAVATLDGWLENISRIKSCR